MNLEFELTTAHIWVFGGIAYFLVYCFFYRNFMKSLAEEKNKRKVTDNDYAEAFFMSIAWPITLLILFVFFLPLIGVKDDN